MPWLFLNLFRFILSVPTFKVDLNSLPLLEFCKSSPRASNLSDLPRVSSYEVFAFQSLVDSISSLFYHHHHYHNFHLAFLAHFQITRIFENFLLIFCQTPFGFACYFKTVPLSSLFGSFFFLWDSMPVSLDRQNPCPIFRSSRHNANLWRTYRQFVNFFWISALFCKMGRYSISCSPSCHRDSTPFFQLFNPIDCDSVYSSVLFRHSDARERAFPLSRWSSSIPGIIGSGHFRSVWNSDSPAV